MVELEEPDKGRAWLIAMAACIINMILSGLSRMIALLYVAVIDEYGVTRAEATLPFSVRNSIRCLAGPLVGIIGQRFGIRKVTFWGGVIATVGASLCCIAPSITWLAVFWGGIHGFGFALANTLFQVVVNQYFKKYRVTASGIALSGACVGSLAFPVLIEWILETYGLSGGFLILGGIVMHVIPCSLLLCSPQWVEYPEAYARLWALKNNNEYVETVNTDVVDVVSDVIADEEEKDDDCDAGSKFTRSTSMSNHPVEITGVWKTSMDNLHRQRDSVVFKRDQKLIGRKTTSECNVRCTRYTTRGSPVLEKKEAIKNGHSNISDPQKIFTISGQLKDPQNKEVEGVVPVRADKSRKSNNQSLSESMKSIFKLYTNPVYVLVCICMSTYIIIFIPILTVIVDYSMDKGIPESHGKYLINAMAIGDLIGRLCFGWVTDKKLVSMPCFMFLVFLLQGISIVLFPVSKSLGLFMTFLVLYGITAGSILVLFPVLVLKYLDDTNQAVGMACTGFLSGILTFAIPPMIGHFRDSIGSYDGMFFLTGVISMINGAMWLLEPVVVKMYYGEKGLRKESDLIFVPNSRNGSKKTNS